MTATVTGKGGAPESAVAAVVLTVTAAEPSASGFLTVWPAGVGRTNTSTVNFQAGQNIAGTVVTSLGEGGAVQVFNGSPGALQLVVDVAGYTPAGTPTARGTLMPLTPARIADSRPGVQISGAIQGLSKVDVQVAGSAGVPIAGAAAAVLTVTAIAPQAAGFLTVWPAAVGRPDTSSLNFQPGQNIADSVLVPIDSLVGSGRISIFNGSPGAVHVAVDVTGYILAGPPTATAAFASVTPARIADSLVGQQISGAIPPSGAAQVQVAGRYGVPAAGASAVVLTVTAVDPVAAGYLTVWPTGLPRTATSNVNFRAGQNIPNLVVIPLGSSDAVGAIASVGTITIFNGSSGATQVLVDVSGYMLSGVDPDSIAPAAVTSPTISGTTSTLTLSWVASTAADTSGVVIRRALGRTAPRSITDGAFVADVLVPGSGLIDAGLAPATTYSYALFAHDGSGNTATGASVSGTTTSPPVWAWGNGTSGERGNGTAGSSPIPAPVSGLSTITAIAGGASNGFALGEDGTVWSWGDGSDGRLGNGSLASSPVPVRVSGLTATAIAGASDGYALRGDGTVWAWGDGSLGALGNGATASSAVPVPVSGLTNITRIAAAGYTGYAVGSDGTAWAWGAGGGGRLGNGNQASSTVPVRVSGLTDITAVAGGFGGGYALRRDGTVWAWGDGSLGALGNGSTAGSAVPVRVVGLTNVTAIAAGLSTALALRTDGTVWAWGDGSLGAPGNGGTQSSAVPVQVSGLTAVRSIAAGFGTGYAVRSDGTGWAWGDGSAGQLAAGDTVCSAVPVRISGLRTITAIAAGSATAYALGSD